MKAPRFATLTLSLDTEKYRHRAPRERDEHIHYLVDRLLAGEEVSAQALERYGIKVALRDAVKPEIIQG